jgi:hypothetical protein
LIKDAKAGGRRMPDEPSRLLGLAGLRVTRVLVSDCDALDLEVEGVARGGACPTAPAQSW